MRIGLQAMNIFLEGSKHAGVSRTSLALLEAIVVQPGHEYFVFVRHDFEVPPHWLDLGHVKVIRTWSKTRSWALLGRELEVVKHRLDAWFSVSGVVPRIPMRVKGSLVHDIFYRTYAETFTEEDRLIHEAMSMNIARHSTFIASNSEATAQEFGAAYGISLNRFLPLKFGIGQRIKTRDTAPTRDELTDLGIRSQRYIFSISTLEPRKNFPRLLEAFAQIAFQDRYQDVDLVIAGGKGWKEGDTLQAVEKYGLQNRVQFLGYVDDKAVPKLFAGAEFAVTASLDEGFGVPVLEALHFGCPVVCSDRPVMREIANEAAIYFDPLDVASISNALQAGLERTHRSELVETGFEIASGFSWEESAKSLLAHMEKLRKDQD